MQGHIRKRGAGSWEYIIDTGRAPAQRCQGCGKRSWVERRPREACPRCGAKLVLADERRRETKGGFASRREAQAAMSKVLVSVAERTHVASSRMTLRDYLLKEWLPAIAHTVRPTTYNSYVAHVECHILPSLGSVQLAEALQQPNQRPLRQAGCKRQAERQRPLCHSRSATCTPFFTAHSRTPCAGTGWPATRQMPPTRPASAPTAAPR